MATGTGDDGTAWLRIGEVARRTGLTVRTLRHYDELGLLVPEGRSLGDYRLYSPDDLRRLLHIQYLKSIGLGLADIASALDDPDFDAAATLDAHIGNVRARLAAERELLDRLTALRGAADAGWEEILDVIALTERLRHPDASVRLRAALDAPGVAPLGVLVDAVRDDPADGVSEALTWAIVQHGPEAVRAATDGLADPDAGVRLRMAHILGKLGDRAAAGPLASALGDADPRVAAKAVFALGQIGGPDALAALIGVLGTGDSTHRDTVTTALGRFGPDAVAPLVRALQSDRAAVREHAAETLGFRGDADAAPALAAATADPDAGVRLAALVALGELPGDDAGRAIEEALDSPDERTRLVARRLLADRGQA